MKTAISTDGGTVSAHFGRCPVFTIVDVEAGHVTGRMEIPNPGHEPGFLPGFLHEKGVECMIAGGMGRRAQTLFEEQNISTILGVTGGIDEVIAELCSGSLIGGSSLCSPGVGKGYGVEKSECTHDGGGHHG